jgi:glutathione synthase/RimK-type ligase-like ATP-grasp enzyme
MNEKSNQCVVVITTNGDAHIPYVAKHLKSRLVIIDPSELATGKELTFALEGDKIVVEYDGEILDNVVGVWYRKPQSIINQKLPVKDEYKQYSQQSLYWHVAHLLTSFQDALWVSDYFAMIRACNKGLQLAVARKVGLNVPDTIITSSKARAEAFAAIHPQFVSKPHVVGTPKVDGQQKVLLTTLFDKDYQPDLANLHLAPAIFQEAVDVKDDVRVVVVGDQVFAATVNSDYEETGQNKHLRDNRAGHYEGTVTIRGIELPANIASQCVAHVRELGLKFGAIDLLADTNGKWWFLENNPNGQWAYIEHATGQPIGKAIAGMLEGTLV